MTSRVPHRVQQARRPRGFTLVELMVAVTGGLFVSIAVFVLAKQASGFYQSEARAGDATFGSLVGFDRLRADIARAGYLASPNITKDPAVCGNVALYPSTWLKRLASVYVEPAATIPKVLSDNNRKPDEITLAGSYVSPDQFETAAIYRDDTAGVDVVYLRANGPAMVRLGYPASLATSSDVATLERVFQTGRILRIVDRTGREQYGVIDAVNGGDRPYVTLKKDKAPQLEYRQGNANRCGINDLGVGALVNVVNIVRYALREPGQLDKDTATSYAPAVSPTTQAPTDAKRADLVRFEIDPDGKEIAGTAEVVSELAVDLQFGLSYAAVSGTTPGEQTALTTVLPGDTKQVAAYAGDPTDPLNRPQLIRSVRARLSIRSREADRTFDIPSGTPGVADGFYRIGLGDGGGAPYARVRTLQADVALKNQLGVTWQ